MKDKQNKNILVIGINYAPELTGIGKYTTEFCEYLTINGFNVNVITGHPYYPTWKNLSNNKTIAFYKENISGVNVWRCPHYIPNPQITIQRIMQDFSFFVNVFILINYFFIKRRRFDTVFVVSPSILSGLNALWYKFWNKNSKLIYHIQDLQLDAALNLGLIKNKIIASSIKKIELFILENVDLVSTISEGMLDNIQKKSNKIKQIELFPNWANFKKIYPCAPSDYFYSKLSIPRNKKIVLYSGSIGEKQGLGVVIDCVYVLNKLDKDFHFIITGSGPYFNELSQIVKDSMKESIQFFPLMSNEDYNMLLNIAWVHLVFHKHELKDMLMPSKVASIAASGGAVIVNAVKNTSLYNLIHNYKFGFIIEPNNPEALVEVLLKLDEDENEILKAKKNAFDYASNNLNMEYVISNFLKNIELLRNEVSLA